MRIGQTQITPDRVAPLSVHSAQIRLIPGQSLTAWEATIAGTFAPGERVLVLGSGPIPTLWAEYAERAGLLVEIIDNPTETAVARHLGADRFGAIKAVFTSHGDPGASLDPAALRRALDACFHDALLLFDASAAPAGPDRQACVADIVIADPDAGLARLIIGRQTPRRRIASE